jgi:hypothetical protein
MTDILALIDAEIARLQEVRSLFSQTSGVGSTINTKGKRGPKPGPKPNAKRALSPEARKRIAEAQRKRWAAQKKAK